LSNSAPVNILVLVSGNGSNLQALIDAEKRGAFIAGKLALVIAGRPGVYALERAKAANIPAIVEEPDRALPRGMRRRELSGRILARAQREKAGFIVLAGFLSILEGEILREYAGWIINLHPSLLPKYGGQGMYGERVHRAVLDAGERESGCTVHLVDEGADTGPVLLQRRVPVFTGDTLECLAERIHGEEHIAIVEATVIMLERMVNGEKDR
jgi:phosphoribosylglycinamide formyltransferase-1